MAFGRGSSKHWISSLLSRYTPRGRPRVEYPYTCGLRQAIRRGNRLHRFRAEISLAPPGAPAFARHMNRSTRLAVRLLAIAVIVVGAVVLLPEVLGGLERLLRIVRVNWWLVVLVALAIWTLLALGKKR